MRFLFAPVVASMLVSCGGGTPPRSADSEPISDGRGNAPVPMAQHESEPATGPQTGDAPEISRSVGEEGGVVVLWPRVVQPKGSGEPDAEAKALAARVQARLADLVRRARPGVPVDVRPEPERVCPRAGCKAATAGAVIALAGGGGCAVVALISGAGTSPARLIPWSNALVVLKENSVPFREPPERAMSVKDYARCTELPASLAAKDGDVEAALTAALGR